jgi:hypothetical protein
MKLKKSKATFVWGRESISYDIYIVKLNKIQTTLVMKILILPTISVKQLI